MTNIFSVVIGKSTYEISLYDFDPIVICNVEIFDPEIRCYHPFMNRYRTDKKFAEEIDKVAAHHMNRIHQSEINEQFKQ